MNVNLLIISMKSVILSYQVAIMKIAEENIRLSEP